MSNVVVIGARSRRQGIGEYVARWFVRAGARIAAVVGTSAESLEAARSRLAERWEIDCAGYVSLDEALDAERPEIVAICSPYTFHREHIEAAADAGAHCLCEKPLWWDPELDPVDETRRLAANFARKGRFLATVTQWPYTLPCYFQLCPEMRGATVESFAMALSPIAQGADMVPDAVPHGLSMLARLTGEGEVCSPRASFPDGTLRNLRIEFDYRTRSAGTVEVDFSYRTQEHPPRDASYAINGLSIDRSIVLPEYEIQFVRGDRRLAVEDPLGTLVADFLARCERGETADVSLLATQAEALRKLWMTVVREERNFANSERKVSEPTRPRR